MTELYEQTARRFAENLKSRLGESLHSVVLYGSVANGTAHSESDIDVLVIADDPDRVFGISGEVAYELDFSGGFRTFLTPVEFSPDQIEDYLRGGDPFLLEALEEGKVLYDDGTFGKLRRQVVAARA